MLAYHILGRSHAVVRKNSTDTAKTKHRHHMAPCCWPQRDAGLTCRNGVGMTFKIEITTWNSESILCRLIGASLAGRSSLGEKEEGRKDAGEEKEE